MLEMQLQAIIPYRHAHGQIYKCIQTDDNTELNMTYTRLTNRLTDKHRKRNILHCIQI